MTRPAGSPVLVAVTFLATSLLAFGLRPAQAAGAETAPLEDNYARRVLEVSMAAASTWGSVRGDLSHFAENKRGDSFVVRGSIYPPGTIPSGDGVFGPDTHGRIGTWTCRGAFNFDFDPDIAGGAVPHVVTTQVFLVPRHFDPADEFPMGDSIVSEGFEGGLVTRRVIVGGTGRCTGARGEVVQEALGMSAGGLFNLRFTFLFSHLPAKCRLPRG